MGGKNAPSHLRYRTQAKSKRIATQRQARFGGRTNFVCQFAKLGTFSGSGLARATIRPRF